MQTIINFLTGRVVAFLIPWVVAAIQYASHYVDTSKWDAPTISTWIVATVGSAITLWMAQRKKATSDGVKQIQEAYNGSLAPGSVAVDGVAKPDGETAQSVKAILTATGKTH